MSQHTKKLRVNVIDDDGFDAFQLQDDGTPRHIRTHWPVVGLATWDDGIPRAEALANAHLWAAAPLLLEAAKNILALRLGPPDGVGNWDEAFAVLEDAIRSAEVAK